MTGSATITGVGKRAAEAIIADMRRRHDRVPDRRAPGKLGGPLPEAATPTCRPSSGWPGASASRKAAVAVGHSILVIAWHLLTNDCNYHELGGDFFIRRDSDRARQRAVAQLQALGYQVTLQPAA